MKKNKLNRIASLVIFLALNFCVFGQIQEGVIIYERTVNLEKKFAAFWEELRKEKIEKHLVEPFILYFNAEQSVFTVDPNFIPNNNLEWATDRNTTIIKSNEDLMKRIIYYYGSPVYIKDSIPERKWVLTDKYRVICNIECMQAMYEYNDSTRVYAWFSPNITPNVGPESYQGLPGAILGLALEDGSITYFAKAILEKEVDFSEIMPKFNEKKAKTIKDYIATLRSSLKWDKEIEDTLSKILIW